MDLNIIELFQEYEDYALLISILLNIVVAILGIVPSVFITAANIVFFGLVQGLIISYIGEAIGAIIAFILYRKGTKNISNNISKRYSKWNFLIEMTGWKAFYTILGLRLMPYIPSGVVTVLAALGRVSLINYAISSSIGKLPAMLIEGYSIYQVTNFTWQGKVILLLTGVFIIFVKWKKEKYDRA